MKGGNYTNFTAASPLSLVVNLKHAFPAPRSSELLERDYKANPVRDKA